VLLVSKGAGQLAPFVVLWVHFRRACDLNLGIHCDNHAINKIADVFTRSLFEKTTVTEGLKGIA
jgi:hypothetical protein